MTRKDAINRLKTDIYQYTDFSGNPNENEFWEAFDMAIKALEQEQCGDCISREAVMHILDKVGGDFDSPREAVVPIDYIADMVSDLPSVTPQPKTGHWIEYTKVLIPEPINSWRQAWKCSECGYGGQDNEEDGWLEWKYCPNCGAKMESEG